MLVKLMLLIVMLFGGVVVVFEMFEFDDVDSFVVFDVAYTCIRVILFFILVIFCMYLFNLLWMFKNE